MSDVSDSESENHLPFNRENSPQNGSLIKLHQNRFYGIMEGSLCVLFELILMVC